MEGRQVVIEVDAEGCPSDLEAASTKFVNQCGVIIRARIPITTRLWKSSKPEEQQHAVPPHQKEMLWIELMDMFTLLEGVDEELVKKCGLKKMALAFAGFKKKLYTNYIKKDKESNWDDLPQVKPYWEEFKQYKLSEEVLSVETHRRVATGNTKSREVAGALAGTAPSSTARNSVTRPEVLWKTGRAT